MCQRVEISKGCVLSKMDTVDSKGLIKLGRAVEAPFRMEVSLSGYAAPLVCKQIFRLLPGKRLVALAEFEGEDVLVKIFLGRTATRNKERELIGVRHIADADVRTPALLWQGKTACGHGEILAFEYLPDAISLFDRWRDAVGDDERIDILTRAMRLIAHLHKKGVVQEDIHLANFLLSDGCLFTIDGGGISKATQVALPVGLSLHNLGWFFAQFYPRFDDFVKVVLPAYEAIRAWDADERRIELLLSEVLKNRESRKKNYLDKVFRDCTRFACEKSFSRYQVCERSALNEDLLPILNDPNGYMARGVVLKDGNSSTVCLVRTGNRSLVIKRYNIKGSWHAVRRAFRKSRAWTAWSNAYRMEFFGIRSLKPIAMIENRTGAMRGTAYLITEYIEGVDALECLRNMKKPNGELEALAGILNDLSESKITHGDLKATNFLMAEGGPVIIDLDAMREHKTQASFHRAFSKDLDRFMQNWKDQPEVASQFEGLLSQVKITATAE
jgi:tRNA A-37 threonylcarbamoyl transferase component Bud32